jgi:hypothetical protein
MIVVGGQVSGITKKILKTVLKESRGNTLSRSLLIHTSISAIEKRDRGFQI